MNPIYLDNNATTRVADEVIEAMVPYFGERYGNASSMHSFGGVVAKELRRAREQLAGLLGADPEEIVFTSCGTESDSTAIWSALRSRPDRRHLITSRVEHPAVKNLAEWLAENGYRVTFVPVDTRGRLDLDYFNKHLSDDTAIASFMWANNETGTLFPVEEQGRDGADKRDTETNVAHVPEHQRQKKQQDQQSGKITGPAAGTGRRPALEDHHRAHFPQPGKRQEGKQGHHGKPHQDGFGHPGPGDGQARAPG